MHIICLGSSVLGSVDNDNTGITIILSVLYLSAIVGGSTIAILDKLEKKKNNILSQPNPSRQASLVGCSEFVFIKHQESSE